MNALQVAQKNRQIVLDHVNANPGTMRHDLVALFKFKKGTIHSLLESMVGYGELQIKDEMHTFVNVNFARWTKLTASYTALKTVTKSADAVRQHIANAKAASLERRFNNKTLAPRIVDEHAWVRTPGSFVYSPDMPIKNPDAMGSGRQRVYASAACHLI